MKNPVLYVCAEVYTVTDAKRIIGKIYESEPKL